MRCSGKEKSKDHRTVLLSVLENLHSSSAKKARLDETPAFEESTTESGSFEAQAAATKRATLKTIGTVTPIDDFKTLIEQGTLSLTNIYQQMGALILELVHNSHRDALFDKAFQCLQCLRDSCIQKLEPKTFNDLEGLIKKQATAIDGRKDFWQKIVDGTSNSLSECRKTLFV